MCGKIPDIDARIIHSNKDNIEKELELIKQEFDVLVLEGAEEDPEYTLSGLWYYIASGLTFWLLNPIYTVGRKFR